MNNQRTERAATLVASGSAGELRALRERLEAVWAAETSASPQRWDRSRPSTGQCAVTALIVQDLFGGDLLRTVNEGVSHYFNRLPDGTEVDLTRDQFRRWAPTAETVVRDRSYLESSASTTQRYELLTSRLRTHA